MADRPPLAIDRSAAVERLWLDDTSWVDIIRGIIPEPAPVTDHVLNEFAWRADEMWRYEVVVTAPRLFATPKADALPAAVRQLGMHVDSAYKRRFTGPAVIQYRDGNDAVGFHRDREMRWLDDTLIAIVSLGATRPFAFRPNGTTRGDATDDRRLHLDSGDLIVMGGRCQQDWLHAVPRCDVRAPRVSLTWRWTSRDGVPDTSEPYRASRQFGSSGRVGPQRRR